MNKNDVNSADEVKTMSVAEFWQLGFLQEINRQFLHPLGLAMTINIDSETYEATFGPIWDYREDPEGITYGPAENEDQEQARRIKAQNVELLLNTHKEARIKLFGSVIQPF